MEINRMQWYVITAVGGQEESIAQALREKMNNFGYANFVKTSENDASAPLVNGEQPKVKEIRVFMKRQESEQIFNKNSAELPKTLKNTKTTKWETLPDGRYKRTKSKKVNRFGNYIFVCCDLDDDIWYNIRNTVGVMGFVGSTGKAAKPIPCSMDEYERLINDAAAAEYAARIAAGETAVKKEEAKPEVKVQPKPVLTEAPFKVGQTLELINGSFAGTNCTVISINLEKQTAKVEVEFFGRVNSLEVAFADLKLAK